MLSNELGHRRLAKSGAEVTALQTLRECLASETSRSVWSAAASAPLSRRDKFNQRFFNVHDASKMKIISGGQTGVDRAALDFAIDHDIEHGGWCPLGRLAEDKSIPGAYQLQETPTAYYPVRTDRNVRDSDATLIFCRTLPLTGGTLFTKECAVKRKKPVEILCEADGIAKGARQLAKFLKDHHIAILNIAGPRESQAPGLGKFVRKVLETANLR